MLSEDAIERLLQPIIDRQEQINMYVLQKIAERVKEIGNLLPSDVYRLERLLKSGNDVRLINKRLSEMTGLNVKQIKRLIQKVALDSYIDAKPYYDYRSQPFIPFAKNESLQRIVKAIAAQTAKTYINLSNARAFMLRDPKNPKKLIPTNISKTYYTVVDQAIQAVQSGTVDYATAMRRTMEQLASEGIQTVWYNPESGVKYHQSMEAAVKRNILDGVRQISQAVQDEVGRQYGADGKEITVHEMSAPDHEPIQGHQFTNEEYEKLQNEEPFEDVDGQKFTPIARAIGEYNCRHFTYSIIVGVNKPNFTKEQLEANIKRNHQGYTDSSGRHRTLYECSQEQRRMERNIRQAKSDVTIGKTLGDDVMQAKGKADLRKAQSIYREFSKACGLRQRPENVKVAGYSK